MNYTQIHVREYTKETNTDTQRGYIRRRYTDTCKRIYEGTQYWYTKSIYI